MLNIRNKYNFFANRKIAIFLGLIFFVFGVLTLPKYGINWDTINHLPRGQAYLNYFLTGKKDYSNLPKWEEHYQDTDSLLIKTNKKVPRRSFYQADATTFNWFMQYDGRGHPPVSDVLSSFFNLLLFQKLGIINDIDAYRVYGIFLAASLVGLVYYWSSSIYGKFAGLIATLSLSLYPLFWSESHFNNEKDIPETVFWSFMLFFFWKGLVDKRKIWIFLSSIFFGLALGTKFNILFSLFVIIPWIAIYLISNGIKDHKKLLPVIFLVPIVALVIFMFSWPYLWADPISRVYEVLRFYKTIGLTEAINPNFIGPFNVNLYPVRWIIYTTPIWTLVLFVFGVLTAFKKVKTEKHKTALLFLLWFLVTVVRVSLPHANTYGGVRQIMEYIPAMALLAGLGGDYLRQKIEFITNRLTSYVIIFGLFLSIVIRIVAIHPNENVFFNDLIGGLSGASLKKIPSWGNTFGASYRQGVSWINKNVENEAKLVLVNELLPNIPRIFLRPDIKFHNSARSGYLMNGEYAITLTYDGTADRSYYDSYLETYLSPVYEVKVDEVPILKVWKNDKEHLKKPITEKKIESATFKRTDSGVIFDLGKKAKMWRLEINYSEDNCTPLTSGYVRTSIDGKKWKDLPGVLPNYWKVSALGIQPNNGRFIEPFVGQEVRYIDLVLNPTDTCLFNIRDFAIRELL